MKKVAGEKAYFSVNVDKSVVDRLKIEAAKRGWMRYSVVAESFLRKAYKELQEVNRYAEVKEKYKSTLRGFVPLKRGRPPKETSSKKVKLTLYLSPPVVKYFYRLKRKFGLSLNAACELLLRVGMRER